nr:response regulator transcription factor [Tissierella sp.]
MKKKILVAEDDPEIAMAIKEYLGQKGYSINWASNGLEALEEFYLSNFDLAIIDIMMPEMDGFTLCKNIRLTSNIPLIILSARDKEMDKVEGLNIGADDYMTKPFSLMELHARVKRHLKRYQSSEEKYKTESKIEKFLDGLEIDLENNMVYLNDKKINLTLKEFDILNLFIKNKNKILSKGLIYQNIWKDLDMDNNTVTVHIKTLREKLQEDIRNPKFIETVWGKGYRFIGERVR